MKLTTQVLEALEVFLYKMLTNLVGLLLLRAINYCRVFTEMGEAFLESMLSSPNQVSFTSYFHHSNKFEL